MKENEVGGTRQRGCQLAGVVVSLAIALSACAAAPQPPLPQVVVPNFGKLQSGDIAGLNYSTDLIYTFGFEGPKYSGISGGGGPVHELSRSGRVGGAVVSCCGTLPAVWHPDLRLTVRWLAYEDEGNKVVKHWYKAENVRIPKYDGKTAGYIWGVFLPGHRMRIMVPDGVDPNGGNNPDIRPPDNDPYMAQGVRDTEWEALYLKGNNR
ncbi:DUF3304 domain-containing protein [Paraburkholderia adhaesiva]|uniref:DUF3304 domain-containing protein n=1 Tax=Paraburkholderia adhaesiva TaxID=2883244 RepID=UPI001F268BF3|nr:DUF3304 domain-containing protein [Paraburkholderia adhaesiva]